MKHHDENWLTAGIGTALTLLVMIPLIIVLAAFAKNIIIIFLSIVFIGCIGSIIHDFVKDKKGGQ